MGQVILILPGFLPTLLVVDEGDNGKFRLEMVRSGHSWLFKSFTVMTGNHADRIFAWRARQFHLWPGRAQGP